jgi:hypothetical protein
MRARVDDMLNKAGVKVLYRRNGSIMFRAGIFRLVSGWNILLPFSSGRIDVQDNRDSIHIKYKLSTLELLIGVTLMMIVFLATASHKNFNFTMTQRMWLLVFGWIWLFGMNYMIGLVRFPRWLRRGLQPDV